MPFDKRFQCDVVSLQYDFEGHEGNLYMAKGHCCDMTRCIEVFEAIDENVKLIVTWSGQRTDTSYMLIKNTWYAVLEDVISHK